MSDYANKTEISAEKTRSELESLLHKFGADAFAYMTDGGRACIQFRAHGKFVKFILSLPMPTERKFTHHGKYDWEKRTAEVAKKNWEQACRSLWRALFLVVKSKLVAVESKIVSFETEFMAQIILPDGQTVGESIIPKIEDAYRTGKTPNFSFALPEHA